MKKFTTLLVASALTLSATGCTQDLNRQIFTSIAQTPAGTNFDLSEKDRREYRFNDEGYYFSFLYPETVELRFDTIDEPIDFAFRSYRISSGVLFDNFNIHVYDDTAWEDAENELDHTPTIDLETKNFRFVLEQRGESNKLMQLIRADFFASEME